MKTSTRFIATVLMLVMTLPLLLLPASASDVITISADAIDPLAREAGKLVIYTPEYGATTGTNEWGYEVVIEDNRAVKFNTGNSAIPENGFVISGHNENAGDAGKNMGDWIRDNIEIGDYVYYNVMGVITVSSEAVADSEFYSLEADISAFNEGRGANMTVIYNTLGTTTGTNEWGYEIVVTAGVVTKLGGYNSAIPNIKGSFVVSVHGEKVTWYQENVKLGMSASYDQNKKKLTFAYDDTAAVSGMEMKLAQLRESYNAAIKRYDNFDYTAASAAIDTLQATFDKTKSDYASDKINVTELLAICDEFEASAAEAALLISESKTVEYRGVWVRPTETSAEAVEATVQKLYENGINMICVETIYDSTTIMPMPEGCLFECNPKFDHFDMLAAYVEACHERGMELHLWLPIFYVGDYYGSNVSRSVATKKPEWLSVSNTGKYSYQLLEQGQEGSGLMMLNPANKEACDYLLNIYKYILETYDVDGLQLDYIRYYTRSTDFDMGYNEEILAAFEKEYGVRPQYDMTASYWNQWVKFRCQYVTDFVERTRKLIDEVAPDVLLGADVGPDASETAVYNYQDFYTWLNNGWIDVLCPMSYGYGYESQIAAQIEKCGDTSYIAVGLGIFMSELGPADMHTQATYNNSVYADGSVYFEHNTYLSKGTGEYLLKGIYKNKAITPSSDIVAAAKAHIEFSKERINNVILPTGAVSEEGAKTVIAALDKFAATFTADGYDKELYEDLSMIIQESNMMSDAAARILSDLNLAVKGYSIAAKNSNVSNAPELPSVDIGDVSKPADDGSSDVSDETSDVSDGEKNDDNGVNPVVIICIVVIVVAVIAGVVVVVVSKKKG